MFYKYSKLNRVINIIHFSFINILILIGMGQSNNSVSKSSCVNVLKTKLINCFVK